MLAIARRTAAIGSAQQAADTGSANRWLWAAVALSAGLQVAVVHVAFLHAAFSTVPLDAGQWLACVGMASLLLVWGELRKTVQRAWTGRGQRRARTPGPAPT